MKDIGNLQNQLDRILNFFPRVDAKINGLFAVNTFILSIASWNLSLADLRLWYVGLPGFLCVAGLVVSYVFLFLANFPDVKGGQGSLIYFYQIRLRSEATFISDLEACSDDDYGKDIMGQIWRNSEILCEKYGSVKKAIIATTISLVPFFLLLSATASIYGRLPLLKG